MDDQEFVRAFEDCTLPGDSFHHRDHVRLAWIYLREHPPLDALARFAGSLQRYAAAQGHAGLYHETITWAYLFLIHERMAKGAPDQSWEDFAESNPDLLAWKPSILETYYNQETLFSDLAKRVFLLPDRVLAPPSQL